MTPHDFLRWSKEDLAEMVWAKTGRRPVQVRTQALLVVSTFDDGVTLVHRIEDLERTLRDSSGT